MCTRRQSLELTIATLLAALAIGSGSAFAAPPAGKGGGGDDGGSQPASVSYSITLLGTLGGNYSDANGLNDSADVVGSSRTAVIGDRQWTRGFLNTADGNGGRMMIDLQDLFEAEGLIAPFDYVNLSGSRVTDARDINNSGQIIGNMEVTLNGTSDGSYRFRYTPAGVDGSGNAVPAQLIDLGALVEGGDFVITAINNLGDVTGYAHGADGDLHAVVWTEITGIIDLGRFADLTTLASDINDYGQVCGGNNARYRAWRYTGAYENLGVLSNKSSASSGASSINNNGQVAGDSDSSKGQRAFRYTDGEGMKDLGTLGGSSSYCAGGGINTFGDVVGYSNTSSGKFHLFLYMDGTGMADLEAGVTNLPPDLDGYLRSPGLRVNDAREVCGTAGDGTGNQQSLNGNTQEAFLLVPQL